MRLGVGWNESQSNGIDDIHKAIEAYFHAGNVKEGSSEAALLTESCTYIMQVHVVPRHTEDITLVILTTTLSMDLRSDIIVSKIGTDNYIYTIINLLE